MDNPFEQLVSGQADWDSDTIANFNVIERGYHVTERAGQAVSTGQILSLNSGGFFFPYNPNSSTITPHAIAYTAAASGDSITALGWGVVRSLGINSPAVPGRAMFSNASGFLSQTSLGFVVGIGLSGYGLLFNPIKIPYTIAGGTLATLSDVNTNGLSQGKALAWDNVTSKWTAQTINGATLPPMTLLRRVNSQFIPNAAWTLVSWDTNSQDDVSAFTATSASYIQVPSGYTKAEFLFYGAWANNSTGVRYTAVCSGVTANAGQFEASAQAAQNETPRHIQTRLMTVASGDRFSFQVNQTSTATLALSGTGFAAPSYVQVKWYP